jgi:hypothetical protein
MRPLAAALLLACSITLHGCSKSDRPDIAAASGRVTLNGAPVAGATVSFQPVAGGRPCSGVTNAQGIYQITSYDANDGAPVGEHRVAIIKIAGEGATKPAEAAPAEDPSMALSDITGPGDAGNSPKQPETTYLVPQKYSDPATSGLTAKVPPEGSDQLNFELTIN